MATGLKALALLTLAAVLVCGPASAATFTVTNQTDASPPDSGSLRWAVNQANANGFGEDTIEFSLPSGVDTITLQQGPILIVSALRIIGPTAGDPASITINGNGGDGVLTTSGANFAVTLENLTITGGISTFKGGGVRVGSLTGTHIRVTGNSSVWLGGGIETIGAVNLTNSEVSNNQSTGGVGTGGAGGIYAGSSLTLVNCQITSNTTNGNWGGIRALSTSITGSSISNNSAGGSAGGLIASGTVTLVDSLISGNTAVQSGGGVRAVANSVLIQNSTISGNSSTGSDGGGFYGGGSTSFQVINSTITANTASGSGDGMALEGSYLDLQNSILSANGGNDNLHVFFGTNPITGDHSLLGTDVALDTDYGGNVFSNFPGLGALADNGGAGWTHAVQPTSAALDAGDNDLVPAGTVTDQRGGSFLRIADGDGAGGATVDMGAFELNPSAVGIVDVSVEIDEESGPVGVGVIRTGSGTGTALVGYTTANGSATGGEDYTIRSDTISWVDGELGKKTISVPITPDSNPEPDENFTVSLTGLSGTGSDALATSLATVTILDNDLSADLAITKSNYQDGVTIGSSITYTIVVSNLGPDAVTGALVEDTLDPDLTCSWTCLASGGASCTASLGMGDLSDTPDIPNGDSVTYTADCDVDAGASSGTLANTATVTSSTDVNATNNSATDTDTLSILAPLSVELFGEQTGDETVEAQFTITVEDLTIKAPAVLTLRSGQDVIFGDGLVVEDGASLIVEIDPSLID